MPVPGPRRPVGASGFLDDRHVIPTPPSWPPPVVDRYRPPPAGTASPLPPEPKFGKKLGWVYGPIAILLGCVAFGWAGHATMAALASSYLTVTANEPNIDRIRALERWKESEEKTVQDVQTQLKDLRHEFDLYRVTKAADQIDGKK